MSGADVDITRVDGTGVGGILIGGIAVGGTIVGRTSVGDVGVVGANLPSPTMRATIIPPTTVTINPETSAAVERGCSLFIVYKPT